MSDFLERYHDKSINRRLMIGELATIVVRVMKRVEIDATVTPADLKMFCIRMEREILSICQDKYDWRERELPLRVQMDFIKGKTHIDLDGPLAREVAIEIQEEILDFGPQPDLRLGIDEGEIVDSLTEEDLDEEDLALNPDFTYGA